MPQATPSHVSGSENGTRQSSEVVRHEDLLALKDELGPIISVSHWRRADCCDAVVGNEAIGWVLSGLIRKSFILENGQRRIVDLMMPGDVFGLRTDDAQFFTFEVSTEDTLTAKIGRRDFNALVATRPTLYQLFFESACRTIARLETHILVQGRTTSTQKVASYLLSISRRLSANQDIAVTLPLSRYDIADHVGIAVETVSRAITELRRQGVIELEAPRCLSLRDAAELVDVPDRR
jgi:CRP-like cAMP-binding protein